MRTETYLYQKFSSFVEQSFIPTQTVTNNYKQDRMWV